MGYIKRYIEDQMFKGNDVLHSEIEILEEEYCHYSGLPSPTAYQNEE